MEVSTPISVYLECNFISIVTLLRDLVNLGDAERWVHDIDSEDGWQDLIRRLMKRAEDREKSEKAIHAV